MSASPTDLLKRHPLAVEAYFDFVLVLTYAFPASLLAPLLPPGLELDTYVPAGASSDEPLAFVAVAIVHTQKMRPKGLPAAFGQDYMLVGYRLFVRYQTLAGPRLRGLKILRSDVSSRRVVLSGNLLTHYNFHYSKITYDKTSGPAAISLNSLSVDGLTNLKIKADLTAAPEHDDAAPNLPPRSPFPTVKEALKFAGPMPFTFDYERETNSIIRVEGVRQNWHPTAIKIDVEEIAFFKQAPFNTVKPTLCSAFYISDIPYYWKSGICEKLPQGVGPA